MNIEKNFLEAGREPLEVAGARHNKVVGLLPGVACGWCYQGVELQSIYVSEGGEGNGGCCGSLSVVGEGRNKGNDDTVTPLNTSINDYLEIR